MNRILTVAFIVIVGVALWFWKSQDSVTEKGSQPETSIPSTPSVQPRPSGPADEDLIPDPEGLIAKSMDSDAPAASDSEPKATISEDGQLSLPAAVVTELKKCLGSRGPLENVSTSEDLFQQLGEPLKARERWVDWSFKVSGGRERRVHWENVEDDSGKIRPTLMVFDLDEKGDPVPFPMDARDQEEPSQDYVDGLLAEGQGVQKETSNLREYIGGIHLEYLEKNGQLKEVEFERDNIFFRCDQVTQTNTCHCFN